MSDEKRYLQGLHQQRYCTLTFEQALKERINMTIPKIVMMIIILRVRSNKGIFYLDCVDDNELMCIYENISDLFNSGLGGGGTNIKSTRSTSSTFLWSLHPFRS